MTKVEQIKVKSVYGDMYCVSMYINGKLVDAVNGVTEAEVKEYERLHNIGKLYTPQATETPQISTIGAEVENVSAEERNGFEIKISSITDLNVYKYKLRYPALKSWAVKFGLVDLVRKMEMSDVVGLGGTRIDNNLRQSLSNIDKAIISAVRSLITDAEDKPGGLARRP